MKVLIWILVLCIPSVITTALKNVGIGLGFLPTVLMYAGAYWLAKFLCEKWQEKRDLHRRGIDVDVIDGKATIDGKSRREYLIEHTPKFIIDFCEERHTVECLESLLKPYVKSGVITKKMASALAEEFGDK
jgi:hypothetical protein